MPGTGHIKNATFGTEFCFCLVLGSVDCLTQWYLYVAEHKTFGANIFVMTLKCAAFLTWQALGGQGLSLRLDGQSGRLEPRGRSGVQPRAAQYAQQGAERAGNQHPKAPSLYASPQNVSLGPPISSTLWSHCRLRATDYTPWQKKCKFPPYIQLSVVISLKVHFFKPSEFQSGKGFPKTGHSRLCLSRVPAASSESRPFLLYSPASLTAWSSHRPGGGGEMMGHGWVGVGGWWKGKLTPLSIHQPLRYGNEPASDSFCTKTFTTLFFFFYQRKVKLYKYY